MRRYHGATDDVEVIEMSATVRVVRIAIQNGIVKGRIFGATDFIDSTAQNSAAIDETFASTLGQILTVFDPAADALIAIGRHTRDFGFVAFGFCCKGIRERTLVNIIKESNFLDF